MPSGAKPISGFADGVPAAGDYFVFESVGGVTLKIAFADLQTVVGAGNQLVLTIDGDEEIFA